MMGPGATLSRHAPTPCRDGDDELANSLVSEEAPESKIQTSVVLAGAITIGAIVVSTLVGRDPWGG